MRADESVLLGSPPRGRGEREVLVVFGAALSGSPPRAGRTGARAGPTARLQTAPPRAGGDKSRWSDDPRPPVHPRAGRVALAGVLGAALCRFTPAREDDRANEAHASQHPQTGPAGRTGIARVPHGAIRRFTHVRGTRTERLTGEGPRFTNTCGEDTRFRRPRLGLQRFIRIRGEDEHCCDASATSDGVHLRMGEIESRPARPDDRGRLTQFAPEHGRMALDLVHFASFVRTTPAWG